MYIYLAARYSRRFEMQAVAKRLEALGHHITSRWIYGLHDGVEDEICAQHDLHDLRQSTCSIHFTEQPNSPGRNRGGLRGARV